MLQIVTTNSSRTNYNDQNWAIAREYSNHIFKDLEEGVKTWKTIGLSIQTDAYIFSKDAIQSSSDNLSPKTNQSEQTYDYYTDKPENDYHADEHVYDFYADEHDHDFYANEHDHDFYANEHESTDTQSSDNE